MTKEEWQERISVTGDTVFVPASVVPHERMEEFVKVLRESASEAAWNDPKATVGLATRELES